MKVYITKYALTQGIIEAEAEAVGPTTSHNMISTKDKNGRLRHWHGDDWWFELKEALNHVERMRVRRIHSLKRQIEKLERLDINIIKQ